MNNPPINTENSEGTDRVIAALAPLLFVELLTIQKAADLVNGTRES